MPSRELIDHFKAPFRQKLVDTFLGELVRFVRQHGRDEPGGNHQVQHFRNTRIGLGLDVPIPPVLPLEILQAGLNKGLVPAFLRQHAPDELARAVADEIAVALQGMSWKAALFQRAIGGVANISQCIQQSPVQVEDNGI